MKHKIFNSQRQKQIQKTILVLVTGSLALATLIYILVWLTGNMATPSSSKAAPGMLGNKTVSSGTVILNEYTTLNSNASAGATQITVSSNTLNANGRFSGNLAAGELVMIIQMQGASMNDVNSASYGSISNYNNCGRHEFAEVSGVSGSTKINLTTCLKYAYTASGKTQVIRVPRYMNLTVNSGATISCQSWNGSTGGIVAIEVNKITTINGNIDVSGMGFRGGAVEQQTKTPGNHSDWRSSNNQDGAEKGESICGYQSGYSNGRYGRGAPANGGGGGNSHNGGGGGGANGNNGIAWNGKGNPNNSDPNWTTAWELEAAGFSANTSSGGGRGGYAWSSNNQNPLTVVPGHASWGGDSRYNVGGYGGHPLDYSGGRIFMGGGGGAGDSNDGKGTAGGNGGGIIFLVNGGDITGTGTITANGNAASNVTGSGNMDAPGGGGGGGTIIAYSRTGSVSNLTFQANGGNGGSWVYSGSTNENEGTGGGGGGGYISLTNPASVSQSVMAGAGGQSNNSIMSNFTPNGSTNGNTGQTATNPASPYSGSVTLPIVLTNFSGHADGAVVILEWTTASEQNNNYFTLEKSDNGSSYTPFGTIKGAGNSSIPKSYSATDREPLAELTYYRLTQTDFNGQHTTFPPVVVDRKVVVPVKAANMRAFPNPFHNQVSLEFNYNGDDTQGLLKLTDVNARPVQFQVINLVNGKNSFTLDRLQQLPGGFYFLHVESDNRSLVHLKLLKN